MEIVTEQQRQNRLDYFLRQRIENLERSTKLYRRLAYDVLTGDGDIINGYDDGAEPKYYNE